MKKVLITRKLRGAISILSSERMSDCTDLAYIMAIRKHKIKASTIYKIMSLMRYQWNGKRWFWRPFEMKIVRKVFVIASQFDEPIIKGMIARSTFGDKEGTPVKSPYSAMQGWYKDER